MRLPFFSEQIDTQIMEALLYTLLHSLWLGAITAFIAAIIISLTRKAGPHVRYNLFCLLLVLFCVSTGFIFQYEMKQLATSSGVASILLPEGYEPLKSELTRGTSNPSHFSLLISSFIAKYSFLFVGAWFLIVTYKLVWFISDFNSLARIRKSADNSPATEWQQRLSALASSIGISSQIQFKLSTEVTVPMVIGIFKPVIIFPLALFNALSIAETEAILLHELSHIRRQDFLVNIMQRVTEIVFFFNPPIRWVSELIRRERENCCDDLAIAVTKDKKQYIYALVAFQEHHLNQQHQPFLTAFPGDGEQVFNRVNRILTNNNKSLNAMEKLFLASAIVVSGLIALAFSHENKSDKIKVYAPAIQQDPQEKNQQELLTAQVDEVNFKTQTPPAAKDTIPKSKVKRSSITIYSTDINGMEYEVHKSENEVVKFKINGKEVPVSDINKHQAVLDTIDKRMERDVAMMAENFEKMSLESKLLDLKQDELKEHQIALERLLHDQQNNKDYVLQDKLRMLEEMNVERMLKDYKTTFDQQHLNDANLLNSKQLKELELINNLLPMKEKLLLDKHQNLANALQWQEQALLQQHIALEKNQQALQQHNTVSEIIQELVEEGIIKDSHNLKFKLTSKELIINGKKQSADTHSRILKRFQVKPGSTVNVEYNINN